MSNSGDPSRGNNRDRAARRRWLLAEFGNGETAPCALRLTVTCLVVVDANTITVDRIIPGHQGGRYTRSNIQPACPPCNNHQGGKLAHAVRGSV